MAEEEIVVPNDTTRAIRKVAADLKAWVSDLADPRIKAMILTKLEEAELLSFRLVKKEEPTS